MTADGVKGDAAERDRRAAADKTVEFLAWDALQALIAYQDSVESGPNASQTVGKRLVTLWNQFELTKDDFPEPTEEQRILVAAAGRAASGGEFTVEAAVQDAAVQNALASGGDPSSVADAARSHQGVMKRLRGEREAAYGSAGSNEPGAGEWLTQSLSRLAVAAEMRRVVRSGVVVEPGREARTHADETLAKQAAANIETGMDPDAARQSAEASLRQHAEDVLDHGRQLNDSRGALTASAKPARVGETVRSAANVAMGATAGAAGMTVVASQGSLLGATWAVSVAVAVALATAREISQRAMDKHAANRNELRTARGGLTDAIEQSPFSVRSPGHTQLGERSGGSAKMRPRGGVER
ncbi:hypothetical protein AB0F43_24635 [Kribbella sp. NPDC023972]|uniref:hypothetical protein n=1 Tax=Kribbella sp. NPDC023972 TaxID=3154795 RepID=UPI0033F74F5B